MSPRTYENGFVDRFLCFVVQRRTKRPHGIESVRGMGLTVQNGASMQQGLSVKARVQMVLPAVHAGAHSWGLRHLAGVYMYRNVQTPPRAARLMTAFHHANQLHHEGPASAPGFSFALMPCLCSACTAQSAQPQDHEGKGVQR